MVWCGVVWCGVVWCGVVWCGGEGSNDGDGGKYIVVEHLFIVLRSSAKRCPQNSPSLKPYKYQY